MLHLLYLVGVAAFAASGVLAAYRANMDPFGGLVLAFAASVSGGTLRDTILNRTPVWTHDWVLLTVIICVGVGTIESVIDRDVAARAMESLSVSERTLLSLAYLQGMTAREIAEADGIPLGTVKTRLRSALIKLRRAGVKEPT